jgi:hypothetical protein
VRIVSDDARRHAAQAKLTALAHRHTWGEALAPLAAWLERPARAAPAMDLGAFERDERTDPPPGSLAARVPLPLRKHVLGPAKRSLRRAVVRLGDS